jgi:hypothetical protein
MKLLTRSLYESQTSAISGKHWEGAHSRWAYHSAAVELVRGLDVKTPGSVLEVGTMGVQIVLGSDTMDYDANLANKDWLIAGHKPTIMHDARNIPWPVSDGQYELLIALRVFHHLKPLQRECFAEVCRVARNIIIVVPGTDVHPRGIDEDDFIQWNRGVPPTKFIELPGRLGRLFYWFRQLER